MIDTTVERQRRRVVSRLTDAAHIVATEEYRMGCDVEDLVTIASCTLYPVRFTCVRDPTGTDALIQVENGNPGSTFFFSQRAVREMVSVFDRLNAVTPSQPTEASTTLTDSLVS